MNRRLMLEGLLTEAGRLPFAYQEVEYIESTGTQYIDTLVNTTSDLSIDVLFDFNGAAFFGAITAEIVRHHAFNDFYHYGDPKYGSLDGKGEWFVDVQNLRFLQDGTKIANLDPRTFDLNLSYWLFARNSNAPDLIKWASGKIWFCKLWNGSTLVRDFVPCYRKADNEIGLYDLVNKQFYMNAGTGTFLKGPDI